MWQGIWQQCRRLGVNLVYIGLKADRLDPEKALLDWLTLNPVDGLIIWNSFITYQMSVPEISAFFARFRNLPIVVIEREVPGMLSILADNRQGMEKLLGHLINEHQKEKIAYLALQGSHISNERQRFFEESLTERGMFNPDLVFTVDDLREGNLVPGKDFDGLVAHFDSGAVQALDVIKERYGSIPADLAVCGFNDGWEARGFHPSLTTARLPFREMGASAVDAIVNSLRGGAPSKRPVIFPMSLMVRRSCGCLEPMAENAAGRMRNRRGMSISAGIEEARETIVDEMREVMSGLRITSGRDWAGELFDTLLPAFIRPVPRGQFTNYDLVAEPFNRLVIAANEVGENISRWNESLSIIYGHMNLLESPATFRRNQALIQQLRVLLGQTALRLAVHREWEVSGDTQILRDIEADFVLLDEKERLPEVILTGINRLGIRNLDIQLCGKESQFPSGLETYLSIRDGKLVERTPSEKPGVPLLAQSEGNEPMSCVVLALHAQNQITGLIFYYEEPGLNVLAGEVLQTLAIQVSNALWAIGVRSDLDQAQREANEANQLKTNFLSTVSHELRTPLALIVGLSELTLRNVPRTPSRLDQDQERHLRQIMYAGQHLDRLIRDVLDLASSQAGQITLLRKEIDLQEELQEVAELGEQMARQKGLRFRADIPGELPSIWGDRTRIRQILLNLLSNAAKFTNSGEIGLSTEENDHTITIHVSDTGIGILPEDQQRIFEEFAQVGGSNDLGYSGIGLGLAITQRLVKLHGGSITFKSPGVPGKGSVFSITFPIWSHNPGQRSEKYTDTRRQVLLLSATMETGALLKEQLRARGFRVVNDVMDPEKEYQWERWETSPPGVILLDLEPEKESSWDIVRQIKTNPATMDIPVVFYSLLDNGERGSLAEFNYLVKPLRINQVEELLEKLGFQPRKQVRSTVLIVHDEPGILELNRNMIMEALPGSVVYTAMDVHTASNIVRTRAIDLILLDMVFRGMDAAKFIHFLFEKEKYRNIPLIILSGQGGARMDMEKVSSEYREVFARSDYTQEALIDKIDTILSRNTSLGNEGQRMVYKAVNFIHDHYAKPISRADIANVVNINEQYLSRCFTRELGISPIAYLNKYRIEMAKRTLKAGKVNITRLAKLVGYSSQSYFSRAFKKEVGDSPSGYQKRMR